MIYKIEDILALTVGTEAQDQEIRYQGFLMQNVSDSASVYFRDKEADDTDCTSENGYVLGPGESTPVILTARTLSLVASDDDTDVRLMIVDIA